jgi:hypothetical protein
MNRIVREHYPVEKLPEDLQLQLPPGASVIVTVEEVPAQGPLTAHEAVALMRKIQQRNGGSGLTPDEAAAEVRVLRDEWDD